MEVGEVIQFYDSDRQFPAWGFGGRAFGGSVSHCFNLNGSPGDCEVMMLLWLGRALSFLFTHRKKYLHNFSLFIFDCLSTWT